MRYFIAMNADKNYNEVNRTTKDNTMTKSQIKIRVQELAIKLHNAFISGDMTTYSEIIGMASKEKLLNKVTYYINNTLRKS